MCWYSNPFSSARIFLFLNKSTWIWLPFIQALWQFKSRIIIRYTKNFFFCKNVHCPFKIDWNRSIAFDTDTFKVSKERLLPHAVNTNLKKNCQIITIAQSISSKWFESFQHIDDVQLKTNLNLNLGFSTFNLPFARSKQTRTFFVLLN